MAGANPRTKGVAGRVPLCENGGEPMPRGCTAHPQSAGVSHVVHDGPDDEFS